MQELFCHCRSHEEKGKFNKHMKHTSWKWNLSHTGKKYICQLSIFQKTNLPCKVNLLRFIKSSKGKTVNLFQQIDNINLNHNKY